MQKRRQKSISTIQKVQEGAPPGTLGKGNRDGEFVVKDKEKSAPKRRIVPPLKKDLPAVLSRGYESRHRPRRKKEKGRQERGKCSSLSGRKRGRGGPSRDLKKKKASGDALASGKGGEKFGKRPPRHKRKIVNQGGECSISIREKAGQRGALKSWRAFGDDPKSRKKPP